MLRTHLARKRRHIGIVSLALMTLTLAACAPATPPVATPTPTFPLEATLPLPTDTLPVVVPTATTAAPAATLEPTPMVSDSTPTADVGSVTPAPTTDLSSLQWKQVGLGGSKITDLAVASGQTLDLIVAAGPDGAWASKYGYTDWQKQSVTAAEDARNGEAEVASADVLYFTSHTGCASGLPMNRWRSTDGGATWVQMAGEAMTIATSNATTAYATSCNGILKTTDSGATWSALSPPQLSSDPISLAASPDGQVVYAAFVSEGGTGQIWGSQDGGATWTNVTPTNVPPEDGFRAPGHLTYVTGSIGRPDDGGLYLTNDQGVWHLPLDSQAWTLMKKPPMQGEPPDSYDWYSAFLVDTTYGTQFEKAGPILYAARAKPSGDGSATGLGVWRSTDMGASWQLLGTGLDTTTVNSLALAVTDSTGTGRGMGPAAFETLLAGTDDGVWALTP